MFNDIEGQREEILYLNNLFQIPKSSRSMRRDSREDIGHSSGPGNEKKWYGTLSETPEGNWDSTATQMVERVKETSHPVFKSISALSRGILKRKKKQRHHTLQCGCFGHRTLISNCSLSKSAQYLRSSLRIV